MHMTIKRRDNTAYVAVSGDQITLSVDRGTRKSGHYSSEWMYLKKKQAVRLRDFLTKAIAEIDRREAENAKKSEMLIDEIFGKRGTNAR